MNDVAVRSHYALERFRSKIMPKLPSSRPLRILFIGNSFTQRNDLPGLIEQMAAGLAHPKNIETERVIANGASLRQHWNAGHAGELIQYQSWNYVVLQEQSTLPIKNPQRFHENVRLFDAAIKATKAKTVLYLTWARQAAPETQLILNNETQAIAEEIGAVMVPVGQIWQAALKREGSLPFYDKDGSHPSPVGTYLAACVFVQALFGQSTIGGPIPNSLRIDGKQAAWLQSVAAQTMSDLGR